MDGKYNNRRLSDPNATLDGLKIAQNEKVNKLTEICSILLMIIIILIFCTFFLTAIMAFCTHSNKKWIHKLEKKNIETLITEIKKNTQIQKDEFRQALQWPRKIARHRQRKLDKPLKELINICRHS